MQDNGDNSKNHILLMSHEGDYKNCHNVCKWVTREAAQLTVCCGRITESSNSVSDLSYVIHKRGGSWLLWSGK